MKIRAFVAVVLAVVLGNGVVAGPAGRAEAAGRSPAGAGGSWVTLITGDRVLVRGADGRAGVVVEPVRRSRPVQFQQITRHGDQYVLPSDAAALVRAGKLDWQLFNVTGLVRQGYDDGRRWRRAGLAEREGEGVPRRERPADRRAGGLGEGVDR